MAHNHLIETCFRLAERSRIVLLAAGGLDNQEIAAKLDII